MQYYRPQTLNNALKLLFSREGVALPLAGGARLVPEQRNKVDALVDLQALGLDAIVSGDDFLTLGAMVKLQTLVTANNIPSVLSAAAKSEAPINRRNMATVGGTVAVSAATSEVLTALLAFDTRLTRFTPAEDNLSLSDYLAETNRAGLITQLQLDTRGQSASARLARTPADAPIVAATVRLIMQGQTCRQAFIALTGASPYPIRLPEAEAALSGQSLTPQTLDALAQLVSQSVSPVSDYRGSSAYRRQMAGVIVRRAVASLINEQ